MKRIRLALILVAITIGNMSSAFSNEDDVVIVGKVLTSEVKYYDFGNGKGSFFGSVILSVEEVLSLPRDLRTLPSELQNRLVITGREKPKVVAQFQLRDKPEWLNSQGNLEFHLYPLEHTLEFGISEVKNVNDSKNGKQ